MPKIFTKKNTTILLAVLFLGAALYISFGFLPVLKIEGTAVGYSEFQKVYGAIFFFQAEDGIRDVAVTGVQTCALPILLMVLVVH